MQFRINLRQITITALTTLALCASLLPASAQAVDGESSCGGAGPFVSVIDLIDEMMDPFEARNATRFAALQRYVFKLDPTRLESRLDQAQFAARFADVDRYLSDIKDYIQVRTVNGAQFGSYILNKPAFQARHTDMHDLAKQLCGAYAENPKSARWVLALEEMGRDDLIAKKPLNSSEKPESSKGLRGTISGVTAISISKEQKMLLSVFGVLGASIALLTALNLLMNSVRAVKLDRYGCQINAKIDIAGECYPGVIDVISRQGLSFVLPQKIGKAEETFFNPGRRVKFIVGDVAFDAVLTKFFADGGGFRMSKPLSKPVLNAILDQSQTRPRRKVQMEKRKPAGTIKNPPENKATKIAAE